MDIRDCSIDELEEIISKFSQPKFRAKQVYEWLHTHNVSSYDKMTNIPKPLREALSSEYPLNGIKINQKLISKDGSRKYLFELSDGTLVEAVGITSNSDDEDNPERLTVCFSTQVGCAMGCTFCATGKAGYTRNLSVNEIVEQITAIQKDFQSDTDIKRVSNVVAMGQGEPFLNYDEVIKALNRINNDEGIGIGARHITVSTCGIINGIGRFTEEPEQFRLAISLHSANQDKRNKLMPGLSNQTLRRLKDSLIDYNLKRNRRITIEYLMISDVNDNEDDLNDLIEFCKGIHCHVNLIPFNKVDGINYYPSKPDHIKEWERELSSNGIPTSIRYSKGSDIAGACGQLAGMQNI